MKLSQNNLNDSSIDDKLINEEEIEINSGIEFPG